MGAGIERRERGKIEIEHRGRAGRSAIGGDRAAPTLRRIDVGTADESGLKRLAAARHFDSGAAQKFNAGIDAIFDASRGAIPYSLTLDPENTHPGCSHERHRHAGRCGFAAVIRSISRIDFTISEVQATN
ncbi:hypothetical protein ACS0X5_05620 [Burkholderia gladioli]|uniref:hypothetical protein n=1 Tax=Burkholderia gladioli TaxID=28095 RepID=UPI00164142B6|nr:hypothetical protein [Burkholderia gladioli]